MFDFIPPPTSPEAYPPARINPFLKLAIAIVGIIIVLFLIFALIPAPPTFLGIWSAGGRIFRV